MNQYDIPIILKEYYEYLENNDDNNYEERNINEVIKEVLNMIPEEEIVKQIVDKINEEYKKLSNDILFYAPEARINKYWKMLNDILNDGLKQYKNEIWYTMTISIWNDIKKID